MMELVVLMKHKPIFMIVTLVLVLIVAVAVISTIWPRSEERFFELGILGKDMTADEYYPNRNSTLEVGSQVNWYIHVLNHMGSVQDVFLRVKLLNSTMEPPNDQTHEPSPFASFVGLPISLDVDDVQLIPFSWSILDAVSQNGSIVIKRLMVNDQTVDVDVSTDSNSLFRMVFEIWVYDQSTQEYTFEWDSGKNYSSASLYAWFNVSLPVD